MGASAVVDSTQKQTTQESGSEQRSRGTINILVSRGEPDAKLTGCDRVVKSGRISCWISWSQKRIQYGPLALHCCRGRRHLDAGCLAETQALALAGQRSKPL